MNPSVLAAAPERNGDQRQIGRGQSSKAPGLAHGRRAERADRFGSLGAKAVDWGIEEP
jgi:hypothetical protein